MIGAVARKLFGSANERRIRSYLPRVRDLYHAADGRILLPALRNAALFGQIRRKTRGQTTNSESRVEI